MINVEAIKLIIVFLSSFTVIPYLLGCLIEKNWDRDNWGIGVFAIFVSAGFIIMLYQLYLFGIYLVNKGYILPF